MHINTVIVDTSDVYAYCGLFIPFGASTLLTKIHLEFVSAIKAAVIVEDNLGYCRQTDNSSYFCKSCYDMIVKKKIPKFRSANCINISVCQKYPDILIDLIFIKEAFIACIYLVILIIKLRLSGFGSFAFYHWIQGYTMVLSKNPKPLLIILLQVFWHLTT